MRRIAAFVLMALGVGTLLAAALGYRYGGEAYYLWGWVVGVTIMGAAALLFRPLALRLVMFVIFLLPIVGGALLAAAIAGGNSVWVLAAMAVGFAVSYFTAINAQVRQRLRRWLKVKPTALESKLEAMRRGG